MKKYPRVFVIVLNYNGKDTIIDCLKSVYQSDCPGCELVVVDNDSRDGSFELAKNYFASAHFIRNEKNIGFAAGNNVGIRFALEKMADYIFLLNDDAVVEKDTISKLVSEAERNEQGGIFSPLIFKDDGNIWFTGSKIKWLKMKAEHRRDALQCVSTTDYVSGCAMLVRKDVFREIGLFDEKFFLYYEDADFCVRARRKGFKCVVVPGAQAIHYERSEKNMEDKTYWLVLSGLIFFKNNTPVLLKPWINIYLFLRKVKNWLDVKFKKNNLAEVVKKAHRDYKKIDKLSL